MQRRLFVIFLLLSFLPAAAILFANWQMSQRHLSFLDSPGLERSLESSLILAREALARQLDLVRDEATALSNRIDSEQTDWPLPPPGDGYRFMPASGSARIVGALPDTLFTAVAKRYSPQQTSPTRMTIAGGDWLIVGVGMPEGRLLMLRPLAPDLAARLDAVAQGSSRIRQLRLYYSDLMRTDTLITLLIIGLVVLVAALVLSRRYARQIAGPVKALAAGADKVAAGDLDQRVDVVARDELADLVNAFNHMTGDLQQSKEDLVRAERVAAWQGIARRLAHEIKNPLTPITLAMHRIEKRVTDPAVTDAVETVLEEVENLKRLADEFSLYARLPEPQKEAVDLENLVTAVIELYVDSAKVNVAWPTWPELPGNSRVLADPGQLRQVFANLVKNALQAMSGRGALVLGARLNGDRLIVTVSDSGSGLPEDTEQVFEPYFTTRETGTGLGLAISRKILRDHGGDLSARAGASGGAEFVMTIPVTEKEIS